ncbi:ABC transporter permease [Tunicatimonas pelagia]|uniref:ABC transporter permease n=1 Tax=Tunicatimonas pelagia TaxID=931531 RepID=UPI0026662178|nr:ABC transporter permease [Tunicatimonas pelagia]WKN42573.1 ABC transporter permease [Tunicatimonas pelagia]
MLKSYFKIAIRNLIKRKAYSAIMVLSLTLGVISCLLIGTYIHYEFQYDLHHQHADRVYRLVDEITLPSGGTTSLARVPGTWGPLLAEQYPEIESYTRLMKYRLDRLVNYKEGDKQFYEPNFLWADSTVFEVFSIPFLMGNPDVALNGPNRVVISQNAAERYFGSDWQTDPQQNPMGKQLNELTVTGVMQNFPATSHFQADFLVSISTLYNSWSSVINSRTNHYYYTYFLLSEPSTSAQLEDKLSSFVKTHVEPEAARRFSPYLQSLLDIHLHSQLEAELAINGNIRYVFFFGGIALFILLLACINFINLTTARSTWRSKEVGIRKAVGGRRRQLVFQFLSESVLLVILSVIISLAITELTLVWFTDFVDRPLTLHWASPYFYGALLFGIIIIALLAGWYPAHFLSSVSPIKALRSGKSDSHSSRLRQYLVVFQFATCIALIASTLIITRQLRYMHDKDLGFQTEHILTFNLPDDPAQQDQEQLEREISQLASVEQTTITSHNLIGDQPYGATYHFRGYDPDDEGVSMGRLHVNFQFLETYGLSLVAGRGFAREHTTDTAAFLINEAALGLLGVSDPSEILGVEVMYEANGYPKRGAVIGVVEDFHFRSLHSPIGPMVMDIQPERNHFVAVRMQSENIAEALGSIQNIWNDLYPDIPFLYDFLDSKFDQVYKSEKRYGSLFTQFALVSIIIACLGLLGLAIFTAEKRAKEISIRKVLGASVSSLLVLLTGEFTKLVLIAALVATPLSWYFMSNWLNNFAYHANVGVDIFMIACGIALGIAWITVLYQSVKAAKVNPIKNLKNE